MKAAAFFSFASHMGFWGSIYYFSQLSPITNHMDNFSPVPLVWMEKETDSSQRSEEPFYEQKEMYHSSPIKTVSSLDFLPYSSKKKCEKFCEEIHHFSEHSKETKVTSIKTSKNSKKAHEIRSEKNKNDPHPNKSTDDKLNDTRENLLSSNDKKSVTSFYPDQNNRMPRYPEEAQDMNFEGGAMFRLTLRSNGSVQDVQCLSQTMNDLLKNEARRTLLTWKFHGNVPAFLEVFVTFTLENS